MKMALQSIDKGGFVLVRAEGTITAVDFHTQKQNPFESVLGPAWSTTKVLLDMKPVSFIDSSAIGWLIDANKQFKAQGGKLVLHSIQPKVRQVLDLLHLGKALTMTDGETAGRQAMTGEAL